MKGGVRLTLTDEEFGQIMDRFHQDTQLPIPSQKRGICATDALSAILWYTDEIRPLLWEIVKSGINSTCDTMFQTLSTEELVLCWLKMTGARVATILQKDFRDRKTVFRDILQKLTPPVTDGNSLAQWLVENKSKDPKMIAHIQDIFTKAYVAPSTLTMMIRQPSTSPEELNVPNIEGAALGEVCSMIYHTYRMRLRDAQGTEALNQSELESISKKTSFGAPTDIVPSMINSSFQLLGVDTEYECGPTLPPFASPLAIYFVVDSNNPIPGTRHAVGLCKINGHWQFLDDNMGYSLPLREEYDTDDTVVNNPLSVALIYKKDKYELLIYLMIGRKTVSYIGTSQTSKALSIGGLFEWPEISRFYVYKKSVDPAILSQMLGYGLTEEEAKPALLATNSNIDAAFEWLQVNNPLALGPPEGVDRNAYTQILRNHRFDKKDIVRALQKTNNDVDAAIKELNEEFVRDIYSGGGRKKTYSNQIMKQRRNTYRRHRKQKGAKRFTFNVNTHILPIFANPNIGAIAIPSQKEAICITDAFQGCLWYTDQIRDRMWNLLSNDVNTETRDYDALLPDFRNRVIEAIRQIRDNAWDNAPDVLQLRLELIQNWMITTSARVGGILMSHNVPPRAEEFAERPVLARQPSQGQDECAGGVCSVGAQCAKWYHLYYNLRNGTNGTRQEIDTSAPGHPFETVRQLAINETARLTQQREDMWGYYHAVQDMANEIFRIAGIANAYEANTTIPSDAEPLAMYIRTAANGSRGGSGHFTAIVKLNGRWFYFDNEVGVAEPLLVQDWNAIMNGQFWVQYTPALENGTTLVHYQTLRKEGFRQFSETQKQLRQRQINPNNFRNDIFSYEETDRIYIYRKATAPALVTTPPAPIPIVTAATQTTGTLRRQSDNLSIMVNVGVLPNNQYELMAQNMPPLLVSRIQGGGNSSFTLTFGGETFPVTMEAPAAPAPQPAAPAPQVAPQPAPMSALEDRLIAIENVLPLLPTLQGEEQQQVINQLNQLIQESQTIIEEQHPPENLITRFITARDQLRFPYQIRNIQGNQTRGYIYPSPLNRYHPSKEVFVMNVDNGRSYFIGPAQDPDEADLEINNRRYNEILPNATYNERVAIAIPNDDSSAFVVYTPGGDGVDARLGFLVVDAQNGTQVLEFNGQTYVGTGYDTEDQLPQQYRLQGGKRKTYRKGKGRAKKTQKRKR